MPNTNLILRTLTSPYGDDTLNSVLSHIDLDNNFIYLKGGIIKDVSLLGANLILTKIDDTTLSVNLNNIISGTASAAVTGGTYDNNTGIATFTNSTGGTFNVSGFTTGVTDTSLYWYSENATPPTIAPIATGVGSIALGDGAEALDEGMFVYGTGAGAGAYLAYKSNFLGQNAGNGATNAYQSNFFGDSAGSGATNATYSNFIGFIAGYQAPDAFTSNFIGYYAGYQATNANNSNFFGQQAGSGATYANYSNFIGYQAGYGVTGLEDSDFNSNFLGYQAGFEAISAKESNFIGYQAGNGATAANESNFFGKGAGKDAISAVYSNFIGTGAGGGAANAQYSNFFGAGAGAIANYAINSNFLGQQSGELATNAEYSNFLGRSAGYSATSASYSNLFGFNAGAVFTANNIGANNIIIGTNISLPNAAANSINIGGILFGADTYATTTGNPSVTPTNTGRIGIGTVNPNASAKLDVSSDRQGLLIPRMTTPQRNLIGGGSFATGLQIYNTDTNTFQYWNGSSWISLAAGSGATWGNITGTLSGQTDLQNALNLKQNLVTLTTTGTTGAATFNQSTGALNIPQYSGGSGSSGATWGSITGTLSGQTDLQNALNLKANLASPTFTGVVGLPAGQVVNGVTLITTGLTTNFLRADGTYAAPSGATWGSITGTLSAQTDLQTALNLKANLASPTFTGVVGLPAGQVVNGVTLITTGGTTNFLRADGTYGAPAGTGTGATWGSITGTLSTQTDLQTALNLKANLASPTFTGVVGLPAGQVVNGVTLITTGGTANFLRADGTYAATSGGTWGSITGTLSGQTDLQTALNLKANISGASLTNALVNGVRLITTGGTTNFLRADGTYAAPSGGGGAFIPLSGTAALAPVTGDIEVYDTFKLYDSTPFTGGEKSFEFTSNYVEISNSSSSGLTPTKIQISDNEIVVFCGSESAGVSGDADYSANYGSLSYIQRIYADSERIDGKAPNYTLGVTDLGRTIETTAASANTLTINDTILSTLPIGGKINIIQYGAGQTQVVTAGAAVLLSSGGADKITNQYGAATIIKRSASEFYLFGEITI
jgi:hypothetical protein